MPPVFKAQPCLRSSRAEPPAWLRRVQQPRRPWRSLFLSYRRPVRRISGTRRLMEIGGMETKNPSRSVWHVISEGERFVLFHLTFTSTTENVTECQPLPLDIMVSLTARSYWSQKKLLSVLNPFSSSPCPLPQAGPPCVPPRPSLPVLMTLSMPHTKKKNNH